MLSLPCGGLVGCYAESQSQKMAAEGRMLHQDLVPSCRRAGLMAVGENVAHGYPRGTAVTAGWMAFTGHRANLLNSRYWPLGLGATRDARGRWYVVRVFGSTS